MIPSGCATKPGPGDDDDDDDDLITEVLTPRYTVEECPDASCDIIVRFDPDELAYCFGWDPTTYPGVGWPPSAPPELDLTSCNPEFDLYCDLGPFGPADTTSELDPSCHCIPAEDQTSDCCVPQEQFTEFTWLSYVSSELADGVSNCSVWPLTQDFECALDEAPEWSTCGPFEGWPMAPGADFVLTVDPGSSYVDISCPLGSDTFALSGGGSAATGPARFMTGLVWAASGNLGTHDLTGWSWSFDAPIQLDLNSGAFTVDHEDEPWFVGTGYDDAQPYTVRATIFEDADGTLSTSAWELDFEQSVLSWDVEVHLEGTVDEVD